MPAEILESPFPNLKQADYAITSEEDVDYNCYEKIAIYVDDSGDPSHAARQTSSGKWTSKIGELEDIEHGSLSDLEGEAYGTVAQIMKRPRMK